MTMTVTEPVWTLGERMWKARKDAGLEQTDVATALGVSRALVSRWERDQSDPGTRQLLRFAEITGAGWLLTLGYKAHDDHEGASLRVLTTANPRPPKGVNNLPLVR